MTVPAETLQPVPWDADIASAAALIADSTRAAILRALLPDRPLAAGELARLAGAATASFHLAKLLEGGLITVIRQGLLEEKSGRTGRDDTSSHRFEVTGAGAKELGSFGLNLKQIRRSRRQFAGTCIDWTQRRRHLNGALAAAITSRMFELGWIERGSPGSKGQRRRSVRVTPVGIEGLASTFGVDLP